MNFNRNRAFASLMLLAAGGLLGGCGQSTNPNSTASVGSNSASSPAELQVQADKLLGELEELPRAERSTRLNSAPDVRRFIQGDPARSQRLRALMTAP